VIVATSTDRILTFGCEIVKAIKVKTRRQEILATSTVINKPSRPGVCIRSIEWATVRNSKIGSTRLRQHCFRQQNIGGHRYARWWTSQNSYTRSLAVIT